MLSSKLQTDAATNVVTGKADVFYADSPVAGYAISQTDGQLQALGKDEGSVKQGIAIAKNDDQTTKAVQKAVQKLMDDGTYMKILKHWGVQSGALDKAEINPTDLSGPAGISGRQLVSVDIGGRDMLLRPSVMRRKPHSRRAHSLGNHRWGINRD